MKTMKAYKLYKVNKNGKTAKRYFESYATEAEAISRAGFLIQYTRPFRYVVLYDPEKGGFNG